MKIIQNWVEQKHRCYFCGETRSVKYTVHVLDPNIDSKPAEVYACNRCVLLHMSKMPVINNISSLSKELIE